jgi:hypothetical protein
MLWSEIVDKGRGSWANQKERILCVWFGMHNFFLWLVLSRKGAWKLGKLKVIKQILTIWDQVVVGLPRLVAVETVTEDLVIVYFVDLVCQDK